MEIITLTIMIVGLLTVFTVDTIQKRRTFTARRKTTNSERLEGAFKCLVHHA